MSASKQKVVDACIVVSTPMLIEKGVTAVLLHMLSKKHSHVQMHAPYQLPSLSRRLPEQIDLSDVSARYILDVQSILIYIMAPKLCKLLRPGLM